ncbi:uncharacterized protein HD556DRAFT_1315102 [Suillus plorans]|uniref:Uncharacterized protein n=1 Tax=Suillus plorans TaxID=116603 RepID=A0A9P7DAA3_9AGAM|nr:uncharacterized protein HD556DRAFT_1315102 [Suillus plorans]KAG1784411.1 hypothetical protein HD556DRAFT_1315102 [Suillus plorans]
MDSCTSTPPDQYLTLQSILECILRLDMLDQRIDMLERRLDVSDHGMREAMQEIRSVKNLICNCQSGFTMEHSGGHDSTVDSQAGVNDLDAITSLDDSQIMLQPAAFHGTSSGVIRSLSGGTTGPLRYGARSPPITVKHSGGRDGIVDSQAGLNSLNACTLVQGHGIGAMKVQKHSIYSEDFTASYGMDATESSSEGVGARFDLSLDVDGTSDPVWRWNYQWVEKANVEISKVTGKAMHTVVWNVECFQGSATIGNKPN